MTARPSIPAGTTVYTHQLAGATLDELLEAAERNWWPNNQCEAEWALLSNWAIQTETQVLDDAEYESWDETTRALLQRELPYKQWVVERGMALQERTRVRKLAQTRLRYKYGFKQPRRWGLIARDVRRFYRAWADPAD